MKIREILSALQKRIKYITDDLGYEKINPDQYQEKVEKSIDKAEEEIKQAIKEIVESEYLEVCIRCNKFFKDSCSDADFKSRNMCDRDYAESFKQELLKKIEEGL